MSNVSIDTSTADAIDISDVYSQVTPLITNEIGQSYFDKLAQQLATVLGVNAAFVGRRLGQDQVESIVFFDHEELQPPFTYDLIGAPCHEVVEQRICYYPQNVQQTFPNDHMLSDAQFESYAGTPLFDHTGAVIGIIAVMDRKEMVDAPTIKSILELFAYRASAELERRSYEDALLLARCDAETANRAKSQFLANMSHEIRTPLNGIMGMAEVLMASGLSGQHRDYAEIIRNSGNSLLHILNDILDLAKIESGKMDVTLGPVHISELCESIDSLWRPRFQEKSIQFKINKVAVRDNEIIADRGKVKQILDNLISNSWKFTSAGEVTIVVDQNTKNSECITRFSVKDTGPGISQEDRGRLFEKFIQLDETPTAIVAGTGLGLAICGELAQLLQGNIEVESELGSGSTFTLIIPTPIRQH